jgi:hypothetical protein
MSKEKETVEIRIKAIDSGAALKKGETQVRESQKQSKPQGLSRPAGVIVPPVEQSQGQATPAQNQQSDKKK